MPAMALLDTDGVYGAPRFHLATKKIALKAHMGAEVTFAKEISNSRIQIADLPTRKASSICNLKSAICNLQGFNQQINNHQSIISKGALPLPAPPTPAAKLHTEPAPNPSP
jgi:DNA polymerase III alpha subunit